MGLATRHLRRPGRDDREAPGRAIQKVLTTSEPTSEQLEVGERALEELLRLENAAG